MALRAAIHQVALNIKPPPRSLRESREIYKSLKKFGEIDMYRNLRHENSTRESKEDAVVIFRNKIAIQTLLAASPLRISIPPPPPLPLGGDTGQSERVVPPPMETFTVNAFETDYNHELKIINQLFAYMQTPYQINEEAPPGVSLTFNTKADIDNVSDMSKYRQNLAKNTNGGWYGWRAEMKQVGVKGWDKIKAAPDTAGPSRDPDTPTSRRNHSGWSHSTEPREPPTETSVPASKISAVINPTPLPIDPTLRSFLSRSQSVPRKSPKESTEDAKN